MTYILVVGGGIAVIGWTIVLLDWYAQKKERGLDQPAIRRRGARASERKAGLNGAGDSSVTS